MDIVNHGEKEGWIRIEVTLTAEEAAADIPFIITTLGMQSGVRPQKGRSGKEVLVEALGEENVANFIDNALMRKYIGASFDQAGVDVVGEPVYQCLKTYEEGEKYQFVLMGALKPTMSLSSYGPVTIEAAMPEITEDQVDFEVEQFLAAGFDLEEDTTRDTVEPNSVVGMSISTSLFGQPVEELTFEETSYELGGGGLPEAFDQALVGMKVGETKTVIFGLEGEGDRSLESVVTIKMMLNKIDAQLNDEWVAKHFTAFATVEDFRANIRAELERRESDDFEEYKNFLVAALLSDRIEGTIPDAAFEASMQAMEMDFGRYLMEQNLSREAYLEQMGMNTEELRQNFMLQTQARLRQELALDALARHEEMTLTDDDMQAYLHMIAPGQEEQYLNSLTANGGLREARMQALRYKANLWAAERAIVVEPEPMLDPADAIVM